MTTLDLQKVISSATTITICFAKSKRDADNEKAYARYFVDVYSRVEGLDEWVLDSDLPFWVNDGENIMYYPRKGDVITATWRADYTGRKVKYVTLDGEGVITIELWEI